VVEIGCGARRLTGKCEGNPGHAAKRPEVVALARDLKHGRTLRAISAELAARGYLASSGKPFDPSVVARMVRGAGAK
jgi:hypothetical protein